MPPDLEPLLAYAVALILLVAVVRAFAAPLRLLLALAVRIALGGLAIWLLNALGGPHGLHVGLNPATALIAGVLGLPGLAMLVALRVAGF